MAGRRQHTIPRFILKGFASSRRGDEVSVWMYRRDGRGIELNIKNVGVERDFYGKAGESDLDDRITALETDFASLVDDLRSSPVFDGPLVANHLIPKLIGHLCLRTRQLRLSVLEMTDTMFQGLREELSREQVVQAAMERELRRKGGFTERIKTQMVEGGFPRDQAETLTALLQANTPAVVEEIMPWFLPQFRLMLDEFMSSSRSALPEAMKAGFIDAMSSNLHAERRVENYSKYTWFIVSSPVPVLLGDTVCLFETRGKRRFKPIDDEGDVVQRVYLPLAPDRLLLGTPYTSQPQVDFHHLNKAIARCSYEFMVSSVSLPPASPLVRGLGKWSGVLSDKEFQKLMDEVKQDFLKG